MTRASKLLLILQNNEVMNGSLMLMFQSCYVVVVVVVVVDVVADAFSDANLYSNNRPLLPW